MRHGQPDAGEVDLSGKQASGLHILHDSNLECTISFGELKTIHVFNLKIDPLNANQSPLKEVHQRQRAKTEAAAPSANQTSLKFEGHGGKNRSVFF